MVTAFLLGHTLSGLWQHSFEHVVAFDKVVIQRGEGVQTDGVVTDSTNDFMNFFDGFGELFVGCDQSW